MVCCDCSVSGAGRAPCSKIDTTKCLSRGVLCIVFVIQGVFIKAADVLLQQSWATMQCPGGAALHSKAEPSSVSVLPWAGELPVPISQTDERAVADCSNVAGVLQGELSSSQLPSAASQPPESQWQIPLCAPGAGGTSLWSPSLQVEAVFANSTGSQTNVICTW